MGLVNMKMSEQEVQEGYGMPNTADAPQYPYGLELRLDEEGLTKLGMPALPQVGQKMMITCRVEVNSVSQNESQEGGKRQNVCLQITDMEVGPDKPESQPGESLYKGT